MSYLSLNCQRIQPLVHNYWLIMRILMLIIILQMFVGQLIMVSINVNFVLVHSNTKESRVGGGLVAE